MTKEELAKLIYENFYDEETNTIDLNDLSFIEYKCDVSLRRMLVAKNLYQTQQRVLGNLYQGNQWVDGDLFQDVQYVMGNLIQQNQYIAKNIYQDHQRAGELIYSDNCKENLGNHFDPLVDEECDYEEEDQDWWKS